MAIRDSSQKVGFVYTNIYELYKKAKEAESCAPAAHALTKNPTSNSRVFRADELSGVKITKFEPRVFKQDATQTEAKAAPVTGNPFDDLKSNLNRLTELHQRLRFMLKELEDLVNKK